MRRLPAREAAIARARAGRRLGAQVEWWEQLESTMSALRPRAEAGAPEGLVLVAEVQTAGRGQRQNTWASPPGGLWFSVLLRPHGPAEAVLTLMPRCGAMVAGVLRDQLGLEARVKLPNDVLVGDRKVCGILAEAVTRAGEPGPDWVILGVGLNLANDIPAGLRHRAASLAELGGPVPSAEELLCTLLDGLEALL